MIQELNRSKTQLQAFEARIEELERQQQVLSKKLRKLDLKLREIQAHEERLKEERRELAQQLHKQELELERLEAQKDQVEKHLQNMEVEIETLQQPEFFRMEKFLLRSEIETLEAELRNEESRLENLENLVLRLEEKAEQLEGQIEEKKCELDEEDQKVKEAKQEAYVLEQEIEAKYEKKGLKREIQELQQEIQHMLYQLANTQDYTTTIGSCPKKRTIEVSRENERRSLRAKIEHMKARLNDLREMLTEKETELKDAINKLHSAEGNIRIKKGHLENLGMERKKTDNKLSKVRQAKENCQTKIDELEKVCEVKKVKHREQVVLEIMKQMNAQDLETQKQEFIDQFNSEKVTQSILKQRIIDNGKKLEGMAEQIMVLRSRKAEIIMNKEQGNNELNQAIGEKKLIEGQVYGAKEDIDRVNEQLNHVKIEKCNIERLIECLNSNHQRFQRGLDVAKKAQIGLERGMSMKKNIKN